MRLIKVVLIAMVAFTGLSGCSQDADDNSPSSLDQSGTNNDHHHPGTPLYLDRAIIGVWDGPCVESAVYTPFFEKMSFDFRTGGGMIRQRRIFVEDNCQTSVAIESMNAQWGLSAPIRLADSPHNITIKVLFFGIQTNSALGAANFNSKQLCGYTNWGNGLSRNVTGVECVGYTWSQNDIVLDMLTVREPHLYFGRRAPDSEGRYDLKGRPTELNSEVEYLRR